MTVYEQELRKLFDHSDLVDRPQFSGRVCVGDLGKDLRVRAEFLSTHISSQYDAIRLTVLNRTEGVVDRTLLRFQDVWGKKQVPNNPNFRSGVIPHLWDDYGKVEWYAYHPTAADYDALRQSIGQYLSMFRERTPELERSGPSWSISVLRCGAMWQTMWSLRGRKRRRCLRRGISPSVRICCSRLSPIPPIPPRTRKPGRWDCGCWNPASR